MTTSDSPDHAGEPVDGSASNPVNSNLRETSVRIDWLFRDALRNHQVHPLRDLVLRYRTKAAP
jgi:hypothetical protein